MPRTKKVSSKPKPQKGIKNNDVKAVISNLFQNKVEKKSKDRKDALKECIKQLDLKIQMTTLATNEDVLNQTLGELMDSGKINVIDSFCDSLSAHSIQAIALSSRKTKKISNAKRSLSCADDEGYRTAESNEFSSVKASGRRSRAKQVKTTTRKSRSLSRSKIPAAVSIAKSYTTPAKQKIVPDSVGTVTPKYKPNTPQVLLRRPKQGEVAISLQGSPLLVNNVQADQMANINIPLEDGRLFSIQPQRGLRLSQIPVLDEDVRRQIDILRDNLNKVLSYRK